MSDKINELEQRIERLEALIAQDPAPKRKKTSIPTIEEVREYCIERRNNVNPESFFDHYEANGWMRGKNKIKSWQACIRTWERTTGGTNLASSQNISVIENPFKAEGYNTQEERDAFFLAMSNEQEHVNG